jgi:hypothetical protein
VAPTLCGPALLGFTTVFGVGTSGLLEIPLFDSEMSRSGLVGQVVFPSTSTDQGTIVENLIFSF